MRHSFPASIPYASRSGGLASHLLDKGCATSRQYHNSVMLNRIATVIALAAGIFVFGVSGQTNRGRAPNTVRVTGRILEPDGTPVVGHLVLFSRRPTDADTVTTSETGAFVFVATKLTPYYVGVRVAEEPVAYAEVGTIDVADGAEFAMGDLVLKTNAGQKPWIQFIGTAQVNGLPEIRPAARSAPAQPHVLTIAALYVTCPRLRILTMSPAPAEKCISFLMTEHKCGLPHNLIRSALAARLFHLIGSRPDG